MTEQPTSKYPETDVGGLHFVFASPADADRLGPHLDAIAARPESLPGFEMVRRGRVRKTTVYSFGAGPCWFYVKSVRPDGLIAILKTLARASRARNAWKQGRLLADRGFKTPRVVAIAERQLGPFIIESVLVTEEAPDIVPLGDFLGRFVSPSSLPAARWEFVRELGRFVGGMHRAGIVHGDLRLQNILVRSLDPCAGHEFWLLDNDRTRVVTRPSERLLLRNLQQINLIFLPRLTLTDRLRFFHAYTAARGLAQNRCRDFLRRAARACESRLRRYVREGGPELSSIPLDLGYAGLVRAITAAKSRRGPG